MTAQVTSLSQAWAVLRPHGALARRVPVLGALTVALAVLEAAGIGAIAPLVLLLQAPERFAATGPGAALAAALGTVERGVLLPAAVGVVAGLFVLKAATALLHGKAAYRFAQDLYTDLATRILAGYLAMPFTQHAGMNSAVLLRNATHETRLIVDSLVLQVLTLAAEFAVLALILAVLVWLDPLVALGMLACAGALVAGGGVVLRRLAAHEGRVREASNAAMLKLAQTALSGIREVRIGGLEAAILARFAEQARLSGRATTVIGFLQLIPRVALEAVAVGAVMVALMVAMLSEAGEAALPLLAAYVAAGYRLLPSLNRIYAAFLMASYAWPGLVAVAPALAEAMAASARAGAPPAPGEGARLEAEGLAFTYPESSISVLRDASIKVARGEMVGIVGESGAGKSTLLNLLLGLVPPDGGDVRLDSAPVAGEVARDQLRATVAYVPQHVFIADDTLEANVALGVAVGAIDRARLERAVATAQLSELVASLPRGLATQVGERAARLSGGEAQRIGIARALYLDRPILVLDEATSALDPATEAALLAALAREAARRAVIAVSHRPAALAGCTRVYRLAGGVLTELPDA
jgi:ABC-type multidrug transport system fused ATPase/permease subunit